MSMKMDVQRTYNNYAEVNSKGQQSKVRPNYYPKAKQILDNLEVDEYIKAFALKTTSEVNNKQIDKIRTVNHIVQDANTEDFNMAIKILKSEFAKNQLKSLLNLAINKSSVISKKTINNSNIFGEVNNNKNDSVSLITLNYQQAKTNNKSRMIGIQSSTGRDSSNNYMNEITVKEKEDKRIGNSIEMKNNEAFTKPNYIDYENLYGYLGSNSLSDQRRNKSYSNLHSATNSTFDNFIIKLRQEKLERHKRRKQQLLAMKTKHQEESERRQIELEKVELDKIEQRKQQKKDITKYIAERKEKIKEKGRIDRMKILKVLQSTPLYK